MRIIQGDILSFQGDTIVNPANLFLRHGAGLARVIANAATALPSGMIPSEREANSRQQPPTDAEAVSLRWQREQQRVPTLATGDAAWTSAGMLPYKGIVHAVGPVWSGGTFCERDLLEIVHERAIEVASENGCASIALPAISCGLFRFPVTEAARIAVAVGAWADMDVSFYLFEDAHYEAYIDAAIVVGITVDTTPLGG